MYLSSDMKTEPPGLWKQNSFHVKVRLNEQAVLFLCATFSVV